MAFECVFAVFVLLVAPRAYSSSSSFVGNAGSQIQDAAQLTERTLQLFASVLVPLQVSPADWEAYITEIAGDILREQSPKCLYLVCCMRARVCACMREPACALSVALLISIHVDMCLCNVQSRQSACSLARTERVLVGTCSARASGMCFILVVMSTGVSSTEQAFSFRCACLLLVLYA